jgi:hypothetical protein
MKVGTLDKAFVTFHLLANVFHSVRQVGEDLVLFRVHTLALGMDPAPALATLHHPGVVVVVVVTSLAEWAVGSLLLLVTAV